MSSASRIGWEKGASAMSVEIRIRWVDGGGGAGDGHEARQVAVLDEVVLAEPHQVEAEAVEQADLLEGLGVDVLQRVRAAGRAAEVVGHAEAQRRAPVVPSFWSAMAGTVRQVPAQRGQTGTVGGMAKTATALELPPLTTDLEEAKAHLDEFGIARIADALDAERARRPRAPGSPSRPRGERGRRRGLLRRRRRQPAAVEPAEQGRGVLRPPAHAGRAHAGPPHPRRRLLPVEPHRQHRRPRRRADGAAHRPGLRAAARSTWRSP